MKKIKSMLMIIGVILSGVAYAQKPAIVADDKAGWHKIGQTTANFKAEKDELVVLGADRFKAIKIMVKDAPIHIAELEVYYENGTSEKIALKNDFKAGGESRVIDLKGASSELKKVVFTYSTAPNSKDEKSTVELYGLK